MWLLTAIAPVLIVGGIVVYVIGRLKHKYDNGTLGKKKIKRGSTVIRQFNTYRNACWLYDRFDFRYIFPELRPAFS